MDLGAFSISLAVKDLEASISFYEKLGFEAKGGGEKWKILVNGSSTLGLFEGMFEENILTFNPGWNQDATNKEAFEDIRELERRLKISGLEPVVSNCEDKASGPAHLVLVDPDGNRVMLDQHR